MKIEQQLLEDHQVKINVIVESEVVEQTKQKVARQLARKVKIPGFRPGKAPYHVIQRFVGEDRIFEESLEDIVEKLYPEILKETGIRPYGPGKLENIAELDPLSLEFVVPLAPEVELGDYRSIRIPYQPVQVDDADVDQALENLRERQAIEEPANRPAEKGDHIFVKISAEQLDPGEDEEVTLFEERSLSFLIRESPKPGEEIDDQEWPFSGFSLELVGLSAGESKTMSHSFSEDSSWDSFQGKNVAFNVYVEEVKSRSLPDLDDEFAQTIGEYENLEALIAEVRHTLESEMRTKTDDDYDERVMNQLVEKATIKFPPQMLEDEIDEVLNRLENRLKAQNLDLQTYMKTRQIDEKGLREEARPVAETRLKRSLVLAEIADLEDIQIEKEELQAETERTLEAMSRFMSESELRRIPQEDLLPNLVGNILAEMRAARSIEHLRSIAKGEAEMEETSVSEGEAPEEGAAGEDSSRSDEPDTGGDESESLQQLGESE